MYIADNAQVATSAACSSIVTAVRYRDFNSLLIEHIHNRFDAEHQHIASAAWAGRADLPQLARHFYNLAEGERRLATSIIQYVTGRGVAIDLSGIRRPQSHFPNAREVIALSARLGDDLNEQIGKILDAACEERDLLGEVFVRELLGDRAGEVSPRFALLKAVDRPGSTLFDLERFVSRQILAER